MGNIEIEECQAFWGHPSSHFQSFVTSTFNRTLLEHLHSWLHGESTVRNDGHFEDIQVPTLKVLLQEISLFYSDKSTIKPKPSHLIGEVIIIKDYAWSIFYGVWHGTEHFCSHHSTAKGNLGIWTNNQGGFKTLFFLLKCALEKMFCNMYLETLL